MSGATVYIPLICLKMNHPYKITGFSERTDVNGKIMLSLKDHGDPREIKSLLTHRCFYPHFKQLWQLNNALDGEEATMKLKFYGCKPTDDGGTPIVRISGDRLIAFLM